MQTAVNGFKWNFSHDELRVISSSLNLKEPNTQIESEYWRTIDFENDEHLENFIDRCIKPSPKSYIIRTDLVKQIKIEFKNLKESIREQFRINEFIKQKFIEYKYSNNLNRQINPSKMMWIPQKKKSVQVITNVM